MSGDEQQDWEKDVSGDVIEDEDGNPKFVLVDDEFEDGRIESDTSVRLDKVE